MLFMDLYGYYDREEAITSLKRGEIVIVENNGTLYKYTPTSNGKMTVQKSVVRSVLVSYPENPAIPTRERANSNIYSKGAYTEVVIDTVAPEYEVLLGGGIFVRSIRYEITPAGVKQEMVIEEWNGGQTREIEEFP